MKILATGTYKAESDYFSIIIDKVNKEIFALKNFSCMVVDDQQALASIFKISIAQVRNRFCLVHSAIEINENLIPKKYKNFTILN